MVFSSFTFLIYFLPAFLLVYFLVPGTWKNLVVFVASLLFYYYGVREHPLYVLLLILSIAVNYMAARHMEKGKGKRRRQICLAMGMIWNIGCLFVFKYADFFSSNLNLLFDRAGLTSAIPYIHFVLPIGISFYTFQISSYLIDVYRRKIKAENSILTLGTYLCMFPQLIAGPIVTYSQVETQMKQRECSIGNLEDGFREFTVGMALKVLIANRVGYVWTQVNTIGFESISCPLAWLGIVAYTFQIYFDFYGYSLMAKGLGRIMGFDFPDNFQDPYLSCSMTEFWRRWHMTLGSWLREYVYIPLGGNRKHLYRNLFCVWMLTGLWHGASWNFILWGLILFLLIVLEKWKLLKAFDRWPLLGRVYMILAIPLSWLIFAVGDLKQLSIYLWRLFPLYHASGNVVYSGDFMKYGTLCFWPLTAALLCCTGVVRKLYETKKYTFIMTLGLVLLFWACVYCMYMGLDDPFLYYQF